SFARRHSGVVALKPLYTSCIVSQNNELLLIYTRKLTVSEIENQAGSIRICPVFVQQYIPKAFELRVTIVGSQIFSCAIHSQSRVESAEDWRRLDASEIKHQVFRLPQEIEVKVRRLMKSLGLVYGAIDMIVTPAGDFYFLEINPNGHWHWIEHFTGLKI